MLLTVYITNQTAHLRKGRPNTSVGFGSSHMAGQAKSCVRVGIYYQFLYNGYGDRVETTTTTTTTTATTQFIWVVKGVTQSNDPSLYQALSGRGYPSYYLAYIRHQEEEEIPPNKNKITWKIDKTNQLKTICRLMYDMLKAFID